MSIKNNSNRRNGKGLFVLLPHAVIEHHDYLALSNKAIRLLIDLALQYNGYNNGDLCATFSIMQKRGWKSKQQLQAAIDELQQLNFIIKTRQGGRKEPTLYAVTWHSIDDCKGKLDVSATRSAPRFFK